MNKFLTSTRGKFLVRILVVGVAASLGYGGSEAVNVLGPDEGAMLGAMFGIALEYLRAKRLAK